jgi:3-oxoacyl-[acyl-carrier protein] reductase
MTPQTIFITGAASGIGLQTAHTLILAGHRVVATDLNLEALQAQAAQKEWPDERVICLGLDVRSADAWQAAIGQAVERFGRLHVLLNIAGVMKPGYIIDLTTAEVDWMLDVNLKGAIYGTQAAAHHMRQHGGGHIINIGSLAGLAPIVGIGLYSVAKSGLRAFSLITADELKPHRIAVSVIHPDGVQTPMLDIEKSYPEAALTFSGTILSADEVTAAIVQAIKKKPLEVSLPRSRGWLAKLASTFPRLGMWIRPMLTRRGLKRQAKLK